MDASTAYLLASLTGVNTPVASQSDATGFSPGNVTTATAMTKAWTMLPGTPAAGTVYHIITEFTGTFEANALAFDVQIGVTWTQFTPAVAASAWSAGQVIAGWLDLTVRVLTATTARVSLKGAISETTTSISSATFQGALAPVSQSLTIAAGTTLTLGYHFGAGNAAQGLATYGSDFITLT